MIMTDTNITLSKLIQQATLYLDELNYSEGSKYHYILKWKHLQSYAKTQNYDKFSIEVGKNFLSDYYGIKGGMKLSTSQVFKIRCDRF
jgi:integrase/recombinase XerD